MQYKKSLLTLLASLAYSTTWAMPALDTPKTVKQPQHLEVPAFVVSQKGDEWSNWIETDDGYSVIRDESSGVWYYANKNAQGKLERSDALVGKNNPLTLNIPKHLAPTSTEKIPAGLTSSQSSSALNQALTAPTTGTVPTLFILVKFNDRAENYSSADFSSFVSNKLVNYFNETSYGRLQITPANETSGTSNDGIVGWLTLNQNHPNTSGSTDDRNRQLTADAITAANPYVNFASYDTNADGYVDAKELAIVVIPAGFERAYSDTAPSVWGHQWSLGWGTVPAPTVDGVKVGHYHNGKGGYAQFGEVHGDHQATLGIMAHELGHLIMAWPDLYDIDSSNGASAGLGNWSLMAGGSWAYKSGETHGQTPVHPDAWSKVYAGWVTPISNAQGSATLPAAGSATATSANAVHIQTTSDPKQYFLFENRGLYGYDQGLYIINANTGGIAVYHVDENMTSNADASHKMVDLEEADNDSSMDISSSNRGKATHLYYSGNTTTFDDSTTPNSKLYGGVSSNVIMNAVSAKQQDMTANFGQPPVYNSLSVANNGNGVISSNPTGINCGSSCSSTYTSTTSVTLTATPNAGYMLSSWSGDCSGTTSTCTLNMAQNRSVTATFAVQQFTLQTSITGAGYINSSPAGINCGVDCTEAYNSGSSVTLTATAATGYNFSGWSGACSGTTTSCTVNMTQNHTATATFTQQATSYALKVSKTGSGTVSSSPSGINCGRTCSANFSANSNVTLTATPGKRKAFLGWSADATSCGTNTTCVINMNQLKNVTATFQN